MTRVFIVDDHPMVVEGLKAMLSQLEDLEVTGHASNASSCLGYFVHNTADVVLLDINLPDQSGIDVCKSILKRRPETHVLALTNFDQLTYLQGMKDAGAKGYLLKNASPEMISNAIADVMKGGQAWLGKSDVSETIGKQNELLLTRREIEVLKHIADGLTNNEIADKLFVSPSTVDSHRKSLISKLQVKNTAALVKIAFEKRII